jgi:hypothetical protein
MSGKTSKEIQMKAILILPALLMLAGCAPQYRYPCQDPDNWGKEECNNEVCKAEGECTADLLASGVASDLIDEGLIEDTTPDTCGGEY